MMNFIMVWPSVTASLETLHIISINQNSGRSQMKDIFFPHSQCLEPCCGAHTRGSAPLQNHMDTQVVCLLFWNKSEVAQLGPTLWDHMGCSLPGSFIHGIFQARVLEWIAISFSRGSSQPRDRTRVSCIAGRRFTIWAIREAPNWKPSYKEWMNEWKLFCSEQPHGLYSPWNFPGQNSHSASPGGSHSLPRGIFPTQGSNPGLLHCRWILYQLSHQGSP